MSGSCDKLNLPENTYETFLKKMKGNIKRPKDLIISVMGQIWPTDMFTKRKFSI